jgi:hypothetical protein
LFSATLPAKCDQGLRLHLRLQLCTLLARES